MVTRPLTGLCLGTPKGEDPMSIRVLAPMVSAGIAAGEVVERPASVVKELVENSLDAGATTITVELRQSGLESLRVTDNGCGIPTGEVELAFARHATSKLADLADLDHITTMGFRGEALPSIAAVAHVRMVSGEAGAPGATWVEFMGGTLSGQGMTSAAPGTSVTVDGLFADLPARRKFLRSSSAETGRVKRAVEYLALASPEVQFTLDSDGKVLLQTPGNGSLRDTAAAAYGADTAAALLEVEYASTSNRVHGLVSPAALTKPNRSEMYLFVNRRWVQHRTLQVAVEEAYRGFLQEGRFPMSLLFVQVPLADVDVNVHPTKREVRFLREGDAFTSVQQAVRKALLADSPLVEARGSLAPPVGLAGLWPASAAAPSFRFTLPVGQLPLEQSPVGQSPETSHQRVDAPTPAQGEVPMPLLRVLGQVANTYLVAEGPDGMYLIDQHAAHEQVLFDRLLQQWEYRHIDVQPLLYPMPLELTPEQVEAMDERLPVLGELGFQMESFGEGTWLARTVPAMARQTSLPRLLEELLAPQRDPSLASSPTHYAMAASIACHSAIRAGQGLEPQEMAALVEALAHTRNPHHCPHGRPTTIRLSTSMLEREFGRA